MNTDAENNTDIIAPKVRQTQTTNETKCIYWFYISNYRNKMH